MANAKKYPRHYRVWTKDEDEQLLALSVNHFDREISFILGRTEHSIWQRRFLLAQKEAEKKREEAGNELL